MQELPSLSRCAHWLLRQVCLGKANRFWVAWQELPKKWLALNAWCSTSDKLFTKRNIYPISILMVWHFAILPWVFFRMEGFLTSSRLWMLWGRRGWLLDIGGSAVLQCSGLADRSGVLSLEDQRACAPTTGRSYRRSNAVLMKQLYLLGRALESIWEFELRAIFPQFIPDTLLLSAGMCADIVIWQVFISKGSLVPILGWLCTCPPRLWRELETVGTPPFDSADPQGYETVLLSSSCPSLSIQGQSSVGRRGCLSWSTNFLQEKVFSCDIKMNWWTADTSRSVHPYAGKITDFAESNFVPIQYCNILQMCRFCCCSWHFIHLHRLSSFCALGCIIKD